jgi:RHS repeat-associated protein
LSSLAVSPWSYNSSNQLTSIAGSPGTTFTYDNNGNTTSKTDASSTTTYSWDYENRLTSVTLPDQSVVSFNYDPLGRRSQKVSASATTVYAYDGENIAEETDASGNAVARYAMGLNIDEPLAMLRGGATHFYSADGLGSVTLLTDGSGAVAASYTYDAFGNLAASTGSVTNPFRYTAREWDAETTHYFYRARYYRQEVGRFVSEDRIAFGGGINFYAYASNNSTNLADPSGNNPLALGVAACLANPPCAAALAAAGAAGAALLNVIVHTPAVQDAAQEADRALDRAADRLLDWIKPRPIPVPITRDRVEPVCTDRTREEDCELQRQNDESVCRMLPDPRARGRCWRSATERYVNCLRGVYIPPLVTDPDW